MKANKGLSEVVSIRVRPGEAHLIRVAAEASGRTLSEFYRHAAVRYATEIARAMPPDAVYEAADADAITLRAAATTHTEE